MCDEAIMVDGIGALYLAGPPLVKVSCRHCLIGTTDLCVSSLPHPLPRSLPRSLPRLQAATGESISSEKLGGAWVHCSVSGCVDHFGGSEEEGLRRVREVVASTNPPGATARGRMGTEVDPGMGASLEDFARLLPAPEEVADCDRFPMLEVRE